MKRLFKNDIHRIKYEVKHLSEKYIDLYEDYKELSKKYETLNTTVQILHSGKEFDYLVAILDKESHLLFEEEGKTIKHTEGLLINTNIGKVELQPCTNYYVYIEITDKEDHKTLFSGETKLTKRYIDTDKNLKILVGYDDIKYE